MSHRKTISGNSLAWLERASDCHRLWTARTRNADDHEVSANRERDARPSMCELRRFPLVVFEQPAEPFVADDIIRPKRLNRFGRLLDADPLILQSLVRPEAVTQRANVRDETIVIKSLMARPSGLPTFSNRVRSAAFTVIRLGNLLRRIQFTVFKYCR
jgi:hypothetical protein